MQDHTPELTQLQLPLDEIPYGYCHCGCGQKTKIIQHNDKRWGHVKGEPHKYIVGHWETHASHRPLAEMFWERVDKREPEECWPWIGAVSKRGYGAFNNKRRSLRATHISYELHFGPIPDGLVICHHCDNPVCVNPNHLWAGTQAENMQDCKSKGRYSPIDGQSNPNSKLTEADVVEIRRLAASGKRLIDLARRFGVTDTTIGEIVHRKRWKHIP